MSALRKSYPARRVYPAWEETPTKPDYKLGAAFEHTQPGFELESLSTLEDTTTGEWILPAIGALGIAFLVGRWWLGRGKTAVAGAPAARSRYLRGLDVTIAR
jgi:hypothetical protein